MRFGLTTPVVTLVPRSHAAWEGDAGAAEIRRIAAAADRLGYDHLSCSEHVGIPVDVADTCAAAATTIRPATLGFVAASPSASACSPTCIVLPVPSPARGGEDATARSTGCRAAASSSASASAACSAEFELLGVDFAGRGARYEDALRALRAALGQRQPAYAGTHYQFADFIDRSLRRAGTHLPIWIGGRSRALAAPRPRASATAGIRSASASSSSARCSSAPASGRSGATPAFDVVLSPERPLAVDRRRHRAAARPSPPTPPRCHGHESALPHHSLEHYLECLERFARGDHAGFQPQTSAQTGTTESSMKIPFSRPAIGEEEIADVVDCLRSGWITTGPRTAQFEKEFAAAVHGAAHALAVTSATAGLHLAMLGLDLQPGDEVITTPLTWPATVNTDPPGRRNAGASSTSKPTRSTSTRAWSSAAVTPRTRAIAAGALRRAAVRHGRASRAAARAPRAPRSRTPRTRSAPNYRGRPIGGIGDAAVFSFHPIKNITTGEGGMITTDDDELAQRMRLLRFHGVERDAWKAYGRAQLPLYDVVCPGLKYNLTDIQSAIGIHQLRKLDALQRRARATGARATTTPWRESPRCGRSGASAYPHRHVAPPLRRAHAARARLTFDRNAFMAEVIERRRRPRTAFHRRARAHVLPPALRRPARRPAGRHRRVAAPVLAAALPGSERRRTGSGRRGARRRRESTPAVIPPEAQASVRAATSTEARRTGCRGPRALRSRAASAA